MLTAAVETIRAALAGASLPLGTTVEKRFFFLRKLAAQTGAESITATPLVTVVASDFKLKRVSRTSFICTPYVAIAIRAKCETEERAGQLCDLTEDILEALSDVETDPPIQEIETVALVDHQRLAADKVWIGELRLQLNVKGDG